MSSVSHFNHKQPTRFNAPEIPQDLATKAYVDSGWALIERATLGADTDEFASAVFTPRKYLQIYLDVKAAGDITLTEINFNDDFTVAYSQRLQDDFGVPASAVLQDKLFFDVAFPTANTVGIQGWLNLVNIADREKIIFMSWWTKLTLGAAALANIRQGLGAYTNATDLIDQITLSNPTSSGDIAAGSEMVVFGSD